MGLELKAQCYHEFISPQRKVIMKKKWDIPMMLPLKDYVYCVMADGTVVRYSKDTGWQKEKTNWAVYRG